MITKNFTKKYSKRNGKAPASYFVRDTKGLSLLEAIIILAILTLILAMVVPQFGKSRETQVLNTAVGDVLSAVSQARAQTLASLDSYSYGVRFETDEVIIFKGTNFSVNDPNNQNISIVSPASITNVTLAGVSGTSGDFYFSRLSGAPSKSGTVTLTSPNFSKIITITATGSASAN